MQSNVRMFKSHDTAKESKRGSKGYMKAIVKALLVRALLVRKITAYIWY